MNWFINCSGDDFDIVIFDFDGRKWEITIDRLMNVSDIELLVSRRISELQSELSANGTYDFSDLIVDYRKKQNLDGNENN